jgi:heat shock protein HslJ
MTFETQFLAAMDAARGYSAEDTELTLFDEAGEALLVLSAEEPASLSGVKWNAIAINNGKQAVASLVAGSEVTATFGEDGKVAGSGGVNEYSGPFTNEEGALKIGPLVSTKMAGADEAVNAQETAFFAAMERSTTYEISGDELNLRDADGATQVQFQAAK